MKKLILLLLIMIIVVGCGPTKIKALYETKCPSGIIYLHATPQPNLCQEMLKWHKNDNY